GGALAAAARNRPAAWARAVELRAAAPANGRAADRGPGGGAVSGRRQRKLEGGDGSGEGILAADQGRVTLGGSASTRASEENAVAASCMNLTCIEPGA